VKQRRWWVVLLAIGVAFYAIVWLVPQTGFREQVASLVAPEVDDDSTFKVGERWAYETRPGEETSTFVVGRIDESPDGRIVHVWVDDVRFGPSPQTHIPHAPMSEDAVARSGTNRLETGIRATERFETGYQTWKDDRGGVFTITIAELVDLYAKALGGAG
jgi:hypothetical protein